MIQKHTKKTGVSSDWEVRVIASEVCPAPSDAHVTRFRGWVSVHIGKGLGGGGGTRAFIWDLLYVFNLMVVGDVCRW